MLQFGKSSVENANVGSLTKVLNVVAQTNRKTSRKQVCGLVLGVFSTTRNENTVYFCVLKPYLFTLQNYKSLQFIYLTCVWWDQIST